MIPNFAIQLYFEIDARRDGIATQFVLYTNTVMHKRKQNFSGQFQYLYSAFTHVTSIYANLLEQKKAFT